MKDIKKNIFLNIFGSFFYLFCQWLITYVIIWANGYNDAGIFSLCMSIGNTFYAISLFGVRSYQSTDLKGKYSENIYFTSRIITSVTAIALSLIYTLLKGYNVFTILCINAFLLFKISESVIDVIHGSLQKKWLYNNISISMILRGVITLLAFIIGIILTHNLLISIIIMSVFAYLCILLYDVKIYKKQNYDFGKFDSKKLKEMLITCLPLAIYTSICAFSLGLPRIYIESVYSSEILGIYTIYAMPAMIVQVAATFFINPLLTFFAEILNNKDYKKFKTNLIKTVGIVVCFGTIAVVLSSLFGKTIFSMIFEEKVINYYYLMNTMIIISLLTAFIWFFANMLIVIRKFKPLLIIIMLFFALTAGFTKYFLINYSLNITNYYIITTMLFTIILYAIYVFKYINMKEKIKDE